MLQVRPERLDEYRRRHATGWLDMLSALRDAGWHDYSLLPGGRPDHGFVVLDEVLNLDDQLGGQA